MFDREIQAGIKLLSIPVDIPGIMEMQQLKASQTGRYYLA